MFIMFIIMFTLCVMLGRDGQQCQEGRILKN